MVENHLPAPKVPSTAYDKEYYSNGCAGSAEWASTGGREFNALYQGYADRFGLRAGDVVVDVGTGRGEMAVVAADLGALAIGIEYSYDALDMAQASAQGHSGHQVFMAADARALPLPDKTADHVTMLDIVEHLTEAELTLALREARRVLRPGGSLWIHTMPSAQVYDVTYRLQRLLLPHRWRHWPADPRNPYEQQMHVNEQTPRRLRQSLKTAGFPSPEVTIGEWIHNEFVPDVRARRLYHRLAKWRWTAQFGACDIWARGIVPPR